MEHPHQVAHGVQLHRLPVSSGRQLHQPVEVCARGAVLPLHPPEETLAEQVIRYAREVLCELGRHGAGHLLPVRLVLAAGHSAHLILRP